ncbi:MAG: DUF1992 domain-containing protein [Caldilinea sp. CFX5]|nr:DUF1992 domain-containing protein [Caldilinea sp. CFX5]
MGKSELKAKEKAAEYREQKQEPSKEQKLEEQKPPGPRSEAAWNDLISHRIDEAMRNGAFDNLRNKGKPLLIERNPYVPEGQQMANDLLKNNNLVPHWISERNAMLDAIARFRAQFQAISQRFQTEWQSSTDIKFRAQLNLSWQRQVESWGQEIKDLNRRITTLNLQQPVARLEIFKVLLDEELMRAGMKRTLE